MFHSGKYLNKLKKFNALQGILNFSNFSEYDTPFPLSLHISYVWGWFDSAFFSSLLVKVNIFYCHLKAISVNVLFFLTNDDIFLLWFRGSYWFHFHKSTLYVVCYNFRPYSAVSQRAEVTSLDRNAILSNTKFNIDTNKLRQSLFLADDRQKSEMKLRLIPYLFHSTDERKWKVSFHFLGYVLLHSFTHLSV